MPKMLTPLRGFRYLDEDIVDSVTGSDYVATPAVTMSSLVCFSSP